MECPNCQQFKTWRPGSVYFWGGLVFALLSTPWVFILIGIPFLIGGAVLALFGWLQMRNGNPRVCRNCGWREGVPADTDG